MTTRPESPAPVETPSGRDPSRRRRCLNDGKLFPITRSNRRFCCRECKDEYNRYGSAFGPLKDWLTKLIKANAKENADREIPRQFAAYIASVNFRKDLAGAGFLHRSQIRKRPLELKPKALKAELDKLEKRVTSLENWSGSTLDAAPPPKRQPVDLLPPSTFLPGSITEQPPPPSPRHTSREARASRQG